MLECHSAQPCESRIATGNGRVQWVCLMPHALCVVCGVGLQAEKLVAKLDALGATAGDLGLSLFKVAKFEVRRPGDLVVLQPQLTQPAASACSRYCFTGQIVCWLVCAQCNVVSAYGCHTSTDCSTVAVGLHHICPASAQCIWFGWTNS